MASKKILYITTQLIGTLQYFSWCSFPDIWHARIQRRVLSILKERGNIELFIRFYPNDTQKNPNIEWARKEFNNLTILHENLPQTLMQQKFDLIITEACATTLLEILCTTSQIVVFIPKVFIKLNAPDKILLQKRLYLAEDAEEYYEKINLALDALQHSQEEPPKLNDEFLFKYCFPSIEEEPLTLTKNAIESILTKAC